MSEGQPVDKIGQEQSIKPNQTSGEFQGAVINGVYMTPKIDSPPIQEQVNEKIRQIRQGRR